MNPQKLRLVLPLLLFVLILFAAVAAPAESRPEALHKFFADVFEQQLRDSPQFATAIGRHDYDDRWNDWSRAGLDRRRAHLQQWLKELDTFPVEGLPAEDRLSVRLLHYDLQQALDAFDLENWLLSMGQMFGLHNRVYLTVDRMPAQTLHDYQNILARLRAVPAYVDQNIAMLNDAVQHGYVQPRLVVDIVSKQISTQAAQTPENTNLLVAFRHFPSSIPGDVQAKMRADATDAYQNQFVPAWRKLLDYVQNSYAPHARTSIGLSALPGGREAYAILVRRLTTTNMTPDEIHKIGEEEVARIEKEMLAIARSTGFNGSLEEFQRNLQTSLEQHFRSREEMLVYCRNTAKIIEPQLPVLFKHIPLLLYGVRPIPEDREQASASNAQAPSPDGSTPGWFNLKTYEPEKQVKFDKEALVLHEAVPGHIFQITLAHSLPDLPEFRKFYFNSAYAEGWALYAESLGAQLGVYRDPHSRFGQLSSERFRAVRLVVDTGIHTMGWTRDQAIEYFRMHAPEESVSEIDRYISWPAQALAYKVGQLQIVRLRQQAEQSLGVRFDIRDFHDAVLRDGALPMEWLQQQVQQYISSAKQSVPRDSLPIRPEVGSGQPGTENGTWH
ncbi:MAG TPA: DUF885 domain-containing protein [Terriglobales bacterium]|nr:DUF885 domain-containing protein [Terriglobales bacterium]